VNLSADRRQQLVPSGGEPRQDADDGIIIEPKKPASARPTGSADPAAVDPQHQKVNLRMNRYASSVSASQKFP
jgi:hypothetical protein